jgi:hypothetical protein
LAFLEYKPEGALYHYTSAEGFDGIVGSKHLWFSDLSKMNDPREINLGHDMVLDAIKFVRHNDFVGSRGMHISILYSRIAKYLKIKGMLSCSFSTEGDVLPLWRAYGADCAGLSVGFRSTAISAMPIRIQKIKYLPAVTRESIIELVREAVAPFVHREFEPRPEDWIVASVKLISAMVSLKHGVWEYEREIRGSHAAVHADGSVSVGDEPVPSYEYPDGKQMYSNLLTRKSGCEEIRYLPLPFGKYNAGVHNAARSIERVFVGCKCRWSKDEVGAKLRAEGFSHFEILDSECKIR